MAPAAAGPACAARAAKAERGADAGPGAAQRRRLISVSWFPHGLRYLGASLMLAQGTPLHVVSEVLGHASIAITKDVYGHLLEGDKRAAAESMSRALFGG